MKELIRFLAILTICLAFAYNASAQDCPPNLVCVTPEAARAALEAGDRAKALEAEITAKDQAYAQLKDVLADMRQEFARASGENTILKQRAVSDAALIELLTKMVRPKKFGVINF